MELAIFNLQIRVHDTAELKTWNCRGIQHALNDACTLDLEEDGNQMRPYTIALLHAGEHPKQSSHKVEAGEILNLRVTALNSYMYTNMTNQLIPAWQSGFVVDDCQLVLQDYACESTRYESLYTRIQGRRSLSQRTYLTFHSPTVFRQTGGSPIVIPLPEYVFGNLANRWQAFSSFPLHPDTRIFARESVEIESYNLKTVVVDNENGRPLRGFVGNVTYRATRRDTFWLEQLHVLAEFSRFSGIGVRTAAGMGQAALRSRPPHYLQQSHEG